MKLTTARLCLDCDEVTDRPTCPACAGRRLWNIALWLDKGSANDKRRIRAA